LALGLGFGLESALHWTWLWNRVSIALGLGFGIGYAWHWIWLWTTVSMALDSGRLGIGLGFGQWSACNRFGFGLGFGIGTALHWDLALN
jgi:hypothetical protein